MQPNCCVGHSDSDASTANIEFGIDGLPDSEDQRKTASSFALTNARWWWRFESLTLDARLQSLRRRRCTCHSNIDADIVFNCDASATGVSGVSFWAPTASTPSSWRFRLPRRPTSTASSSGSSPRSTRSSSLSPGVSTSSGNAHFLISYFDSFLSCYFSPKNSPVHAAVTFLSHHMDRCTLSVWVTGQAVPPSIADYQRHIRTKIFHSLSLVH